MAQKFTNAARATFLSAVSSGATSFSVTAGGGALFPVANTGASAISEGADYFKAVLQDENGYEIVYVRTHTSGSDTFSDVLRGQDGTTARSYAATGVIAIRPLAADQDAAINLRVPRTSRTGSAQLPRGTIAQRDASPVEASIRGNSDTNEIEAYIGGAWRPIGASGFIESVTEFTATAGQTLFTTSYTPGLVHVLRNGVRLGSIDVNITSGTAVVLSVGANLNDLITVVRYTAATIANAVAKSGDTMSGPLEVPAGATGNQVPRASEVLAALAAKANLATPTITGLREVSVAMPANNIDLAAGNHFTKTLAAGAVSLTVSNVPASGTLGCFILDLTNGGAATLTLWSGLKWAGGAAPTLTVSGRDVLGFYTSDGGTTWTGLVLAKDVK